MHAGWIDTTVIIQAPERFRFQLARWRAIPLQAAFHHQPNARIGGTRVQRIVRIMGQTPRRPKRIAARRSPKAVSVWNPRVFPKILTTERWLSIDTRRPGSGQDGLIDRLPEGSPVPPQDFINGGRRLARSVTLGGTIPLAPQVRPEAEPARSPDSLASPDFAGSSLLSQDTPPPLERGLRPVQLEPFPLLVLGRYLGFVYRLPSLCQRLHNPPRSQVCAMLGPGAIGTRLGSPRGMRQLETLELDSSCSARERRSSCSTGL